MEFPSFNTGAAGELTFAILNDVFRRIERLETDAKERKTVGGRLPDVFLASIGIQNGAQSGEFSFVEVCSDGTGALIPFPGGRTSASEDGTFAFNYPAICPIGTTIGSIVPLMVSIDTEARHEFQMVVSRIGTPFIVTGVSTLVAQKSWTYTVVRAEFNGSAFVAAAGAVGVTAYNGAENATDGSSYGVGFIPGNVTGLTLARQAIKTGVVVFGIEIPGPAIMFSMPNGYSVSC